MKKERKRKKRNSISCLQSPREVRTYSKPYIDNYFTGDKRNVNLERRSERTNDKYRR